MPAGDSIHKLKTLFREEFNKSRIVFTKNGRNAIYYTLQSLQLSPQDEVILPAYLCSAALAPIRMVATPVFADIKPSTYNITPSEIRNCITPRTKAVLVPHLYGNPCQMEEIQEITEANDLVLIEDVAQALGGKYKGKPLGSFGDFTILSFRFTKDISSFLGGAIVTDKEVDVNSSSSSFLSAFSGVFLTTVALKMIRFLPSFLYSPIRTKLLYPFFKSQASEIEITPETLTQYQCHLLFKQFQRLPRIIEKRRKNARRFDKKLSRLVEVPKKTEYGTHTYSRYTIRVAHRNEMYSRLLDAGIEVGRVYDESLAGKEQCPNSWKVAKQVINLPVHHQLRPYILHSIIGKFKHIHKAVQSEEKNVL